MKRQQRCIESEGLHFEEFWKNLYQIKEIAKKWPQFFIVFEVKIYQGNICNQCCTSFFLSKVDGPPYFIIISTSLCNILPDLEISEGNLAKVNPEFSSLIEFLNRIYLSDEAISTLCYERSIFLVRYPVLKRDLFKIKNKNKFGT